MKLTILGLIGSVLICFTSCAKKEASFNIEEIPICYKDYGFHLGMDFDTVKTKLPELLPNKKGPNKQTEKIIDFYSISEKTVKVSKFAQMNPTVYASFSEDQELLGMTISYLCSCSDQLIQLEQIVKFARIKLFTCMSENFIENGLKETIETENYSSQIQLDTSNASFWNLSYEIKLKPK